MSIKIVLEVIKNITSILLTALTIYKTTKQKPQKIYIMIQKQKGKKCFNKRKHNLRIRKHLRH